MVIFHKSLILNHKMFRALANQSLKLTTQPRALEVNKSCSVK